MPSARASTTAGNACVIALPEVVIIAHKEPALPHPSAKNAADRSSPMTTVEMPLSFAAATSGVLRDPGATTKRSTPFATKVRMIAEAHSEVWAALLSGAARSVTVEIVWRRFA